MIIQSAVNRLLSELLNKKITECVISTITDSKSVLSALANKRFRSNIVLGIKGQLKILDTRSHGES